MFTLRVPVLQTGAFTITLPAVNYSSSGNNNRYPFFFPSSFCYNCLLLHFSDRVPVRSACYIILFSKPVTGIEPVSTAWKAAMLAVTPHGHQGDSSTCQRFYRLQVLYAVAEVPVIIIRKLFPYESLPILCCYVLQISLHSTVRELNPCDWLERPASVSVRITAVYTMGCAGFEPTRTGLQPVALPPELTALNLLS